MRTETFVGSDSADTYLAVTSKDGLNSLPSHRVSQNRSMDRIWISDDITELLSHQPD